MNFIRITYFIAPAIGLVTTLIGICAVLQPKKMAIKFGIPADESALPYVVTTGIRDVFIGLTVLTLYYLKEWEALGAINLYIGIVALSDFKVVHKNGNKKYSYIHLGGAIVVILYGLWLPYADKMQ